MYITVAPIAVIVQAGQLFGNWLTATLYIDDARVAADAAEPGD